MFPGADVIVAALSTRATCMKAEGRRWDVREGPREASTLGNQGSKKEERIQRRRIREQEREGEKSDEIQECSESMKIEQRDA